MSRPRLLRGHVACRAFVISPGEIGVAAARERVLRLWEPGARLLTLGDRWLLVLARERTTDCATAPGLPLRAVRGGWSALEPASDETAPAADTVTCMHSGSVSSVRAGGPVDQSQWADMEGWVVADGEAPAPPVAPLAVQAPPSIDPRAKAGISAADGVAIQLAREMSMPAGATGGRRLRSAGAGLLAALASLLRREPSVPGHAAPRQGFMARARAAIERTRWMSALARHVGELQARYLTETLDLFERGEMDEALRRAIPLGGAGAGSAGLAWRLPAPRRDLGWSLAPAASGRSLLVGGPTVFDHLRAVYRDAADRLIAAGRIDAAVFVLAELLKEAARAADLLEKHGRLREAAELAEARGLPSSSVVRLWWLAGEKQRALRIARLHRIHGDVLRRLEADSGQVAEEFRCEWAHALAASGRLSAAVTALWPVRSQRDQAEAWMDALIESNSPAAGRMLARKLAARQDDDPELRDRVLRLAAADGEAAAAARAEFALESADSPGSRPLRVALRPVLRRMFDDMSAAISPLGPAEMEPLLSRAGPQALVADAPLVAHARPAWAQGRVLDLPFDGGDAGTRPVFDAGRMEDGSFLLALGEGGIVQLDDRGRETGRFDEPAHRFCMPQEGSLVVTLAGREGKSRLAKIDGATGRAERWGEASVAALAPEHDGTTAWLGEQVTPRRARLLALDLASPALEASWGIDDLEGTIVAAVVGTDTAAMLLAPAAEVWRWALPSLVLRGRAEIDLADALDHAPLAAVTASGTVVTAWCEAGSRTARVRIETPPKASRDVVIEGALEVTSLAAATPHVAVSVLTDEGLETLLIDADTGTTLARFLHRGAERATARFGMGCLTVADDLGRVRALHLTSGRVIADLRA